MKDCLFVFSIDTEEEWNWHEDYPSSDISVKNVAQIPAFHKLLTEKDIKATYFLDFAVLNDSDSLAFLRQLKDSYDNFEFGTHLHPWVTPPVVEVAQESHSHIVNLPLDTVSAQLTTLTEKLKAELGFSPTSFRSGRWGINNDILKLLIKLGYTVDSSVYPYYHNQWFNYQNVDSSPMWIFPNNEQSKERIFELPVSVGFNQKDFSSSNKVFRILEKAPWRHTRTVGALWHLNLLKKIYLSPELSSLGDMKKLCDRLLENDYPVIHMYIHSSSLLPGSTKYVKDNKDKLTLLHNVVEIVKYLRTKSNLQMCTISEAAKIVGK